ncbi:MAG: glycerol-3-phosphate dehydrogenase [Actinomycetota bacterium]|nr:glycerol-3-phosphate dehydrogenase [Actinomycetota bacterium]
MKGIGSRESALERLSTTRSGDELDLLVIGGGITGAGIALDAAARGMSVGLVERGDFASGTSSKSSKLVHGGLRYLEQREFGLMREAAQERDLLRSLAPHLVEPIPFVLPVADKWARAKFGVGLWAYDALASFKNLSVHRYLGVDETEAAVPAIPKGKIKGGFLFYDCKNDDVRLVMEVLIQAVRYGAVVCNYTTVESIDGTEQGCAAQVRDVVSDASFEIRAKKIISAAGVWGDKVEHLANPAHEQRLRPSKGVHLSFSRSKLPMGDAAAFIPDAERKRFLFVIPWLESVIVGTTDTHYEGDIDAPSVEPEDRRYCIDAINSVFHLGLTDEDVTGAWAGLRPLIAGKAGATADLSRSHSVYDIAPNVIGITGGKLTTYRRMAGDAVDRIVGDLGVTTKSKTGWIRLGTADVDALRAAVARRGQALSIAPDRIDNLVRCYGDRALSVLDLASELGMSEPLVPGMQPIAAEAVYCARHEMVVHLSDLLGRRTRLSLTDIGAGIGVGSVGAQLLAAESGWTAGRTDDEIRTHRAETEHERGLPLNLDAPRDRPLEAGSTRGA